MADTPRSNALVENLHSRLRSVVAGMICIFINVVSYARSNRGRFPGKTVALRAVA